MGQAGCMYAPPAPPSGSLSIYGREIRSDLDLDLASAVCCVTLGESSNLSELQVSHLKVF